MDKKTGDFPWLKLGVFAKTGDIEKAIKVSVNESGRPYSGSWKPEKYDVYFQLSHGVTVERSLQCNDCHGVHYQFVNSFPRLFGFRFQGTCRFQVSGMMNRGADT